MIGFALGCVAALAFLSFVHISYVEDHSWLPIVIIVVLGVIGAIIALLIQKPLIILSTCLVGQYNILLRILPTLVVNLDSSRSICQPACLIMICLYACRFIYPSNCPLECLSTCLLVCLSVYLSICLSALSKNCWLQSSTIFISIPAQFVSSVH